MYLYAENITLTPCKHSKASENIKLLWLARRTFTDRNNHIHWHPNRPINYGSRSKLGFTVEWHVHRCSWGIQLQPKCMGAAYCKIMMLDDLMGNGSHTQINQKTEHNVAVTMKTILTE